MLSVSELIKLNTDMYVNLGLANPNYNIKKLFPYAPVSEPLLIAFQVLAYLKI